MRKMYCSRCETTETVYTDLSLPYHLVYEPCTLGYPLEEPTYCFGPFFTSAPLELPEDWELNLTEPSPEELTLMDANAYELLLEVAR